MMRRCSTILPLPVCLLLDSTNQQPGRSYTCSVRDTIDQRQTTFPSIRFMQKYSRSYEDDFQMKILWYKLESANDWRFCASSLGIECCQNPIILKIFSHQNISFHILFNRFPNAIFGGQFISVELLHCGRPRKCKRRHFLFRLITCLVTKPQYYSSLLSNKPGHFSKAGQTWNLSRNLHDQIFGRKNFTHW